VEITLSPRTAQRIRAALGDDVDLSPRTLPTVLARLGVEAPTVYSRVLAEISGSQIRLDSERDLHKRRWRDRLRKALFSWGEFESDVGDRLLAKRHVAAAVPLGMAGVILVLLVLSSAIGHRVSPPHGRAAAVARGIQPGRGRPHPALPHHGAPARLGARRADLAFLDPSLLGPVPVPTRSPLPSSGPFSPRAPVGPLGNPVVIDLPSPRHAGAAADGRQSVTSGISPIVYDRVAEEGARSENSAAPLESPPGPWEVGRRVPAHLATGVVVVAGEPPLPVIAETADPRGTWLGRATVDPEGLVQITFALVSPGRTGAVHGIAVDPGRLVPGLLGTTTLRHPRAAAAIVSAAAQAAADYVQALARQEQATIADGWAQLSVGPAAPAWTYVAARLAQGIQPPGDAGAPVETTEVASGAPLVILVTEAP
jgi:hypothetical protein